jgi:hypothetical protein
MQKLPTQRFRFQFEVAKEIASEETTQDIKDRIRDLNVAEDVKAKLAKPRITGLELVGIISTTILIVNQSDELIEKLRKLIKSLKGLAEDIKGIKDVFVESGDKRILLTEVNEDDPEQLKALTHS